MNKCHSMCEGREEAETYKDDFNNPTAVFLTSGLKGGRKSLCKGIFVCHAIF